MIIEAIPWDSLEIGTQVSFSQSLPPPKESSRERESGKDPATAVVVTLTTVSRGIFFNALSVVVGFGVLFASAFLPVKFFGFLVVVSISACLMGALVLLPAICLVFRPQFLEPKSEIDHSVSDHGVLPLKPPYTGHDAFSKE